MASEDRLNVASARRLTLCGQKARQAAGAFCRRPCVLRRFSFALAVCAAFRVTLKPYVPNPMFVRREFRPRRCARRKGRSAEIFGACGWRATRPVAAQAPAMRVAQSKTVS